MKLNLIERKEIVPGIWEIGLDIRNKNFSFKAGQYIRLVLPHLDIEDTKGPARLFSIASSPNNTEKIDIAFRFSESGYKKTLVNLPIGEEVEVEGPWGSFVLPESAEKPLIFIAGGTGITPFLSIIRFAAEEKLTHNITLLYASRDKNNIAYFSELKELAKRSPRLRINFITGIIDEKLIVKNSLRGISAAFYISGPPAMVNDIREILRENKFPEENIFYEEWSGLDFLSEPVKNMFDISTDAIFLTDLSGIIKYANPVWEWLSGWSAKEVVEKRTPRIQKSGKQGPEFYKDLWDHHVNGEVYRHDVVNKRKDGTLYEIDHLYLPLFSAAKEIVGFAAFQREISEEKMREKEKYEKMIQASIDGFWIVSADGHLLDVNSAYCAMSGYSREELIGMHITDLDADDGPEEVKRQIAKVIEKGADIFEKRHQRKDGSIFDVDVSATHMPQNEGRFFTFIRDTTAKKALERSKTEFVSIASHQLKTPLTAISWIVERLNSGKVGKFTKKQNDYLADVYDSNRRMIKLVDDLLSVSRLEEGKIRVEAKLLQFEDLIAKIIKEHEFLMPQKQCSMVFKEPKDKLPLVLLDESLIRQIVGNLLINAIRYSRNGCNIEVKLEKRDSGYILAVADEGIGITKDKQYRVFEKFFRADNAQKLHPDGTGLGLYITKMVVELLGGKIWFESEENKGTTFYVSLPH